MLGSLCPIYLGRTYCVLHLLCMLLARQSVGLLCAAQGRGLTTTVSAPMTRYGVSGSSWKGQV